MRLALVLLIAACGPAAPSTVSPISPVRPATAPAPARATEHCPERTVEGPAPATEDATVARRAEVRQALDAVDRRLDAIDGDLAVAAQNNGLSLVEARVNANARKAMLDAFSVDGPVPDGTPRMLARAVRRIHEAMRERAELSRDLGAQHPEMLRLGRRIVYVRAAAQAQLDAERAFTQGLIETLAALPAKAKPDAIYKARLVAVKATLSKAPASDSPAEVQVAAEQLVDAQWTFGELQPVVGPKHPDMVLAVARLDDARAALAKAIADADAELTARIAAPVRTIDTAAIARRAELAEQARELRREYELLLSH
jgi:hypothetical protein